MVTRALRVAGAVYLATFLLHTADHLRRGPSASPRSVLALGTLAAVFQVVAIVAVLRGSERGPLLAVAVGLPDAVGIVAAHLLPRWGAISDAYPGAPAAAGVTALSWVTAVAEAAAALAFAWYGWQALRAVRAGRTPAAA
ncbi:MAG TPA: hypothetical protein VFQ85_04425 [Mycobacteriales bacterium]|nr:hypothetical protein [Mycobacteriales bacterium]